MFSKNDFKYAADGMDCFILVVLVSVAGKTGCFIRGIIKKRELSLLIHDFEVPARPCHKNKR